MIVEPNPLHKKQHRLSKRVSNALDVYLWDLPYTNLWCIEMTALLLKNILQWCQWLLSMACIRVVNNMRWMIGSFGTSSMPLCALCHTLHYWTHILCVSIRLLLVHCRRLWGKPEWDVFSHCKCMTDTTRDKLWTSDCQHCWIELLLKATHDTKCMYFILV